MTVMIFQTARCLILACGNTLREDDGVGPFLAQWAEEHWRDDARVRVLCDHQWTPDMAEEIAAAETVIFVDCSLDQAPGQIMLRELELCLAEARPGYTSPRCCGTALRRAGPVWNAASQSLSAHDRRREHRIG